MTRLIVDDRYQGQHGIGRYAAETLSRLTQPWSPLGGGGSPTSLRDVTNGTRRGLQPADVLYSPGYAVGPSPAFQVPTVHDLIHIRQPRAAKGLAHQIYYERVLKPTIRKSRHVLTVSETTANDLRVWLRDDSVVIHNAGNGCSPAFDRAGPVYQHGRPYALFVGNFKPHKNPALAFAAIKRFPDLALVVVSSDSGSAKALATEQKIDDRVTVLSGVDDESLASIYRGAEVLLFPSIMEGFGLPVVESLRCGTPVVHLSACASVVEICGATQFGVSDPNDVPSFSDAIELAMHTPFRAPPLEDYTWDRVASSVDVVLSRILKERA